VRLLRTLSVERIVRIRTYRQGASLRGLLDANRVDEHVAISAQEEYENVHVERVLAAVSEGSERPEKVQRNADWSSQRALPSDAVSGHAAHGRHCAREMTAGL
jgi:hypothetical protein